MGNPEVLVLTYNAHGMLHLGGAGIESRIILSGTEGHVFTRSAHL